MNYPMTRTDLESRAIDDELVVLDVGGGRVHRLNRTAAFIWRCCDGRHAAADIAALLAAAHDVALDIAIADVDRTVSEFDRLELMQNPRDGSFV